MILHRFLQKIWKDRNPIAWALWPLSLIYCAVCEVRRYAFKVGILPVSYYKRPIIVVGNMTVGGSGKTPLTLWLVEHLRKSGYTPGVVARGYGRRHSRKSRIVTVKSTVAKVGDEPLMIAQRTNVPVAVANRRKDAVNLLLRRYNCDIFVCDDGLQHYALNSDITIAMIDGDVRFGNSFCLPAGPLRERSSRIKSYDFQLIKGSGHDNEWVMGIKVGEVSNILDPENTQRLEDIKGEKIQAVCGIGNPDSFFAVLTEAELDFDLHPYPDHFDFEARDFEEFASSEAMVLMTEKDAVKCKKFAKPNWWYLSITAAPPENFIQALDSRLSAVAMPPANEQ